MPYAIENKDILSMATEIALKKYDYTPNKSYGTSRIVMIPVAVVLFILLIGSMPLPVVPYLSDRSAYASTVLDLQKPTNVSNNPSYSKYQNFLAVKQHIYVVWMDGNDNIPAYDIYFKVSHNHGKTFSPAVKLSNGGLNLPPLLTTFGSDVYVAWTHDVYGSDLVQFRASHDYGKTFDPLKDIGNSTTSYSPRDIAAYGNNVYVVFERFGSTGTQMELRSSQDRGINFGEPFVYREGDCAASEPHVAAWKNDVYITAQDPCKDHPDLLFRASHDNGTTFSGPIYLGDRSQQVKIIAKDNFVYLTWNEITDVNFRVSSDHGTTFSPSKALEGDVIIGNPIPDIAIAGDRDVYVIWQSNVYPGPIGNSSSTNGTDYDFRTHLFFTASHDNGQKFGPLKRLDGAGDYTFNSRIAAD